MDEKIKLINDLASFSGWPKIYKLDESETYLYKDIKEHLSKESTYLDIIIDGEDFKDIFAQFDGKTEKYKKVYMLGFLCGRIMMKAGVLISYDDIVFLSGNELWDDSMTISDLHECINSRANAEGKTEARIHVFLDDVTDELLQTKINELITNQFKTLICYTSKELLTYEDSHHQTIEKLYDYVPYTTEKAKISRSMVRK